MVPARVVRSGTAITLFTPRIMTDLLRELNSAGIEASQSPISPQSLAEMVRMIDEGSISGKIAKDVFAVMLAHPASAPADIVREKGWTQVRDDAQLEQWIAQAIEANPGPAEDYRNGKDRALGFLVGQIMKASKGQASPEMVNRMLRLKLRGE